MRIRKLLYINFLFVSILGLNSFAEDNSKSTILAKIGNKAINVNEFLQRSELTIRPNNFKDKYTTLNNLITEKILAIEAEKNNLLKDNKIFQGTLKGIKEQLMRDKLFEEIAYNKVQIDSSELLNVFRASIREYELEFYTIRNKDFARKIKLDLDTALDKSNVLKLLESSVGNKPIRKVKFKDPDDDAIHEALYSNPLDTGVVIGPLKLSNGDYIVMKVLSWIDYPVIGYEARIERMNMVKDKVHDIKARKLWLSYQTQVMRGKSFEFDKNSFNILAETALEYYLKKNEKDSLNARITEIPLPKIDIDLSAPFFTVDNKTWKIEDFKRELVSHPLVFRTKFLDRNNFKEQFKLAIVDMVRDHYLTEEAYARSLDKSDDINKTVDMWKDSFLANYYMNEVIKSALEQGIINREDNLGMLKYKESYIRNLQNKYSSLIWINYDLFNKIKLTNIDFIAIRPGVPFPLATPNFPMLIRSENLDYAKH